MSRKGRMVTRSQTISSEIGPPPAKKICLPLGNFSVLPLEINEQILSSLPVASIATLASTSREWMRYIGNWLASSRICRTLIAELKVVMDDLQSGYESCSSDKSKNCISLCKGLGELVRVSSLFSDRGEATRLFWLRLLLAEARLNWKCSEPILRAFSAFLNNCFKSSDPVELDKVMQAVTWKLRMKTYIHTQLKYYAGTKKIHEMRTRHIARTLFTNYNLLVASLKFFTKNKGHECRMTPKHIARLVYVIYGPLGHVYIDWKLVSDLHVSPSSMKSLADFLNMSFWRSDPFSIEAIIKALLDGDDYMERWSDGAIAALMLNLDIDLSVPYLAEKSSCASILVYVGTYSTGMMEDILNRLKNVLSAVAGQKLHADMHAAISREIVSQKIVCLKTCGDCSVSSLMEKNEMADCRQESKLKMCGTCQVCPMGRFERVQTLVESFSTLSRSPSQLRRSARLRGRRSARLQGVSRNYFE